MNAKEKVRKRLLYDLPLVPDLRDEKVEGRCYPEVRVIWQGRLAHVVAVRDAVTIGYGDEADITVDESFFDERAHRLVTVGEKEAVLRLTGTMNGQVFLPEGMVSVAEAVRRTGGDVSLDRGGGAILSFGPVTVVVRMTAREKVRPAPLWEEFDHSLAALFALVFAAGLLLVNAIIETPPIEVDYLTVHDPGHGIIRLPSPEDIAVEKPEPVKKIILKKKMEGLPDAAQARKSLGEEGRVGDKKSRVMNAQGSSRRSVDEKVAVGSGIMGALSTGAQSFDRVFGGGGLGAGLEKTLGMVTGLQGVDQFGSGGLGLRGFGPGGGGNALSIGGLATRGKGGIGNTIGYGMDKGHIGGKELSQITAGGGGAVVMGALDRAVVDAYIKRHLAQIRWCYEKELPKNPTMFGKVLIHFVIAKTGQVATSQSVEGRSTIGSPVVEECVANAVKKIRFPAPKGGGTVVVNYPFVFKNAVN